MTDSRMISPHTLREQLGIAAIPRHLSPDEKRELAENHIPFSIVKAQGGLIGEYGEFWTFTVQAQQYLLRFNMSDPIAAMGETDLAKAVEDEYNAIQSVTESGDTVGPYQLERVEWSGGNPFYKLVPAELPQLTFSASQEALPF